MNTYDFIIVGAGIIGLSSAYELRREGYHVLLVERGKAGMESTWASGGILSPLYPWHEKEAVNQLSQWGQKLYPEWVREWTAISGIESEWYKSGMMILDHEEEISALIWAGKYKVPIEILHTESVMQMEPGLSPVFVSIVYLPQAAQIRSPRLIRAIRESFHKQGGHLLEDTKVDSLEVEKDRVKGVRTERGKFQSECVILTAGAWSAELLKSIGVVLPIEPVRGQMILFDAEKDLLSRMVMYKKRYLIPRRDGKILAGSTLEYAGFDCSTTEQTREDLLRSSVELVSDLEKYAVVAHWAGIRPGIPDGIPRIGAVPSIEGLYINTGHFRNGIQMAPSSARLLVDLIHNRESMLDPSPYQL